MHDPFSMRPFFGYNFGDYLRNGGKIKYVFENLILKKNFLRLIISCLAGFWFNREYMFFYIAVHLTYKKDEKQKHFSAKFYKKMFVVFLPGFNQALDQYGDEAED